jgi:hypothetical protein
MLEVDESELAPEYITFLDEWASVLRVSVPILLARIVRYAVEGHLYVEKIPDYYPTLPLD